jgi:hypothetical protein
MHKEESGISRRDFLTHTGKLSAGLLAAGVLSSCQEPSRVVWAPGRGAIGANERVNLGIVGFAAAVGVWPKNL